MNIYEHIIGIKVEDLDTPSLLLDFEIMDRNLKLMHGFFNNLSTKIRPHVKLHKATPALTHRQLRAGNVVGVTCAKLSEAEIMAQSGVTDILIANQIVGPKKIERLLNLLLYADVKVCVDNFKNVQELADSATRKGLELGVLVEINIGLDRAGVEPLTPAVELAKFVNDCQGVLFQGFMAYDGHCTMRVDSSERMDCAIKANQLLLDTCLLAEKEQLEVPIVSAGGTFTYKYVAKMDGITEIQAGTYLLMDTAFKEHGVLDFDCCLSVLGTLTSMPTWKSAEDLAIIDVGRKSIDTYYGLPHIKNPKGAKVIKFSQEHGRIDISEVPEDLAIGDKVELWVHDANGTINLFDKFHVIKNGIVIAVWDIPLRGKAT